MQKKSKNKYLGWSKGEPVTGNMVYGLSKGLEKASREAKTSGYIKRDVIVKEGGKTYLFRELG